MVPICPICNSKLGSSMLEACYFVRELERDLTLHYAHCPACDFVFCTDPPTKADLETYYRMRAVDIARQPTPADRAHESSRVAFVQRYLPELRQGQRVIDVGPAVADRRPSSFTASGGV